MRRWRFTCGSILKEIRDLSYSLTGTADPGSSGKVNYFHPESTRFSADYYTRADAFSEIGEISTAYIIANGYAVLE